MRKLFAFLFLVVLAAGVWFGARWLAHRGEVKVTVVLDDARGLKRGDPVMENDVTVGRVASVEPFDGRAAVTVRLSRDHRRSIVSDSLFSVEHRALVVSNTFAIGGPVEDGAILHPHQDRLSKWLTKHGGAIKPYLDSARSKADEWIDNDFDSWTAKIPEWKKEGSGAFERHLDEVKQRVTRAEDDLRKSNRTDEARKLKEKFDRGLNEAKKK